MEKVSIDQQGLKILREHALRVGTLEQWSIIALEYIDGLLAEIERARKEAEQYRQNWLRLQDATGEECLELAVPLVEGWREDAARSREGKE